MKDDSKKRRFTSFEDLDAWKACTEVRPFISKLVKKYPSEERFRLIDDMLRASRSTTHNIAGIEAYTPTDNVSELTARTNDNGWESIFVDWLKGSKLTSRDRVFVLSVGGGNSEKNISVNLIRALDYAKGVGAKVFGIVGRDGGYTAKVANVCVIVPTVNSETVTPHTESFQSVILHLIVSHPALKVSEMKWKSVK